MAQSSTPSQAARAAKQIIGSYAHLRPDNPEAFVAAVIAVLAQYPAGVIDDCADPRRGIARSVEFLSIKALTEWCDQRLAFYQGLAAFVGQPPKREEQDFTREEMRRGGAAMRGLFRAIAAKRDLASLTFDEAVALGEDPA